MIQSTLNTIPFFLFRIPAGFPSPATDYMQEEIDLNKYLKGNSSSTFILRVQGDSMTGANIVDGSIIVVDKSLTPKHNSIVVAVVNGEFTIKRLSKIGGVVSLNPANPKYKPTVITEDMNFQVWGVVKNVIINMIQY